MGAHIARLELRILFEELLSRTKDIQLEGPLDYARDSYVRGVKRLGVRVW
jgi:cytochrome P450